MPQGGVISPLMADLYLPCLDTLFHCRVQAIPHHFRA